MRTLSIVFSCAFQTMRGERTRGEVRCLSRYPKRRSSSKGPGGST
ncbi:hypothetical protein ACFPRL_03705 [Pseudoclavibacter helvolus]